MAHLFSPLRIERLHLPNRVVFAPMLSGFACAEGFVDDALIRYYAQIAQSGVGMIMTEPLQIMPLASNGMLAHIGIYHDAFTPGLHSLAQAVQAHGTSIIALIDAPAKLGAEDESLLNRMGRYFLHAAWRALAAGFDGICLSIADHGALHYLASPLYNRRHDRLASDQESRNRLLLAIIEAIRTHFGERLPICLRIIADEFTPGGLGLQDARVVARRAVTAGARLIDVTIDDRTTAALAQFPGWAIPLASAIRRVNPNTPVIGAGLLDDPLIADSVIYDGSVDLVMLDTVLRTNAQWVAAARAALKPMDDAMP